MSLVVCGVAYSLFRDDSGSLSASADAALVNLSYANDVQCDRHDARHFLDSCFMTDQGEGAPPQTDGTLFDESFRFLPPWAGGLGLVGA
jgi:hypothetical protein